MFVLGSCLVVTRWRSWDPAAGIIPSIRPVDNYSEMIYCHGGRVWEWIQSRLNVKAIKHNKRRSSKNVRRRLTRLRRLAAALTHTHTHTKPSPFSFNSTLLHHHHHRIKYVETSLTSAAVKSTQSQRKWMFLEDETRFCSFILTYKLLNVFDVKLTKWNWSELQ